MNYGTNNNEQIILLTILFANNMNADLNVKESTTNAWQMDRPIQRQPVSITHIRNYIQTT